MPSSQYFARLIARQGGLEAVLARLPRPSRREFDWKRRAQFAALLCDGWLSPDAVRCGRTPEQMLQVLEERVGMQRPEQNPDPDEEQVDDEQAETLLADEEPAAAPVVSPPAEAVTLPKAGRRRGRASIGPACAEIPRRSATFLGRPLAQVVETIAGVCAEMIPSESEVCAAATGYVLWRFTSAPVEQIAEAIETTREVAERSIDRMRALRCEGTAWLRLLWSVEWRLFYRLRCLPHRC